MYAIIETGGKQFYVEQGMVIDVPWLDAEPMATVTFDKVLLCSNGKDVAIGTPHIATARVTASCVGAAKGEKLQVFKMRRRKSSMRKTGHRQKLTRVKILDISAPIPVRAEQSA
ncbi:MAG: 50S ribosomal protein L21 [bacterium]|nr:50S ribosomal protein L21 [bacterium]